MNKSNVVPGLLCVIVLASFGGVAMTQENDEFGTLDEPQLQDERRLPEPVDERLLPEPSVDPDANREYVRPNDFGGSRSRDFRRDVPNDAPTPRVSVPRVMRPRQRSRTVIETFMEVVPPEEVAENKKLQDAIKLLKVSTNDAEKKKAADTIKDQLQRQFERDLKQREKELATVEERVRKLRDQLDKRKAAQDDIINLRLQTLVNEANGLGFPTNNLGSSSPDSAYFPRANGADPFAPVYFDDADRTGFVPERAPEGEFRDPDEVRFYDDMNEDVPVPARPTPGRFRGR